MKEARLLKALTEIQEEFIQEAAPPAKPRKRRWKVWAGLAACLCLAAALPLFSLVSQSSGERCYCYVPDWEYGLTTGPDGGSVYFCYEDGVYRHTPGLTTPVKLGDFKGIFQETETGLYCVDQDTGDVDQVEENALAGLGAIPVNDSFGRHGYQFISAAEGKLYWCRDEYPDSGREVVTYETSCTGSETRRLFSTPYYAAQGTPMAQHMAGDSIYFMAKGGILQRYNLDTQEVVTVYNHFWSQLAEPLDWYFFKDFVLCKVTQYEVNSDGTHSVTGHPFYVLPYDGSPARYLTEDTNVGAAPVLWNDTLYYYTLLHPDGDRAVLPVSCHPVTGAVTPLGSEELATQELAVCQSGLYYVDDYALYYWNFDTQNARRILK